MTNNQAAAVPSQAQIMEEIEQESKALGQVSSHASSRALFLHQGLVLEAEQ